MKPHNEFLVQFPPARHCQPVLSWAGVGVAPSYLYFGCRGAEKDFYYREQFQQLQREGVLAERGGLLCACSRDQPGKFYVTHLLALNAPQLLDLLLKVVPTAHWILYLQDVTWAE